MRKHHDDKADRLREDVELRQRNTVWPDTMRNGITVDGYLWKGDPNAPRIQRIGAFMFGLIFLFMAGIWFYLARRDIFWPLYLFAAAFGYVGCRLLRNAFKH